MTVCIAAVCNLGIVGISDRMVTTGDIEFEHPASKIIQLTPNIIAMIAGNDSFQIEILQQLYKFIHLDKTQSFNVKDTVDLYIACKENIENKKIEQNILRPLGLSYEKLSDNYLSLVKHDIHNYQRFDIPATSVIIAGIDSEGDHIYTINKHYGDHINQISCHDRIGFAAIGIGARHASSQLMLSNYNPICNFSESLLFVHNAKKRSEVAPGVGNNTDMILVQDSGCITIDQKIIFDLDKIYKEVIKKESNIQLLAKKKVDSYINNILGKNNEKSKN